MDPVLKQNLCFFVITDPMNSAWDAEKKCQIQTWVVFSAIQTHTKCEFWKFYYKIIFSSYILNNYKIFKKIKTNCYVINKTFNI